MIALFADKLIISTENNSLACRCQPGPQPNCYPRAIQTSETTPCVFLRSDGKARYASYPPACPYWEKFLLGLNPRFRRIVEKTDPAGKLLEELIRVEKKEEQRSLKTNNIQNYQ